jgi:hypothetical protein
MLSPVFTAWIGAVLTQKRAPPNVQFIVDDAMQEWTLPESSFDFIHVRTLGGSIIEWPSLLEKCYR